MPQNETPQNDPTAVQPYKDIAFDAYITWRSLGGLIVEEDYIDPETGKAATNKVRQMTLDEFCKTFKVNRSTVWRWKTQTPDLAEKIRARRVEVVPLARETAAWNQLFLLGMQTEDKRAAVDALWKYLGHFSEAQLPVQRQTVKTEGGFADMLAAAAKQGVIEGEVLDANVQPSTDA